MGPTKYYNDEFDQALSSVIPGFINTAQNLTKTSKIILQSQSLQICESYLYPNICYFQKEKNF